MKNKVNEKSLIDFTRPDACVLEFGGGAGNVSTIIQRKLNNSKDHVVIQPKDGEMFGVVYIMNMRKIRIYFKK